MNCLLCMTESKYILCEEHAESYLYDSKIGVIRFRKKSLPQLTYHYDSNSELRLYDLICKLYGKGNVYRHAHPLWAKGLKGALLEYDIIVPKEKLLIEYDGIQHFKYPNFFHKTKLEFLNQKRRDREKNKLAKDNKFNLIRFNYKENIDIDSIKRKLSEL